MKTGNIIKISIGLFLFALASCKTTQTSMLIADSYDEKKNQTVLTILPYGNITLPEKWTKTSYNHSSKQHFFQNSDSAKIAVAKNPKEKYQFYKAEQTDKNVLTEFVNWEVDYWIKQGLTVKTLTDSSDNGFIVLKVTGNNVNTVVIFGSKNDFIYNFSALSEIWTDEKKERFLIDLYKAN